MYRYVVIAIVLLSGSLSLAQTNTPSKPKLEPWIYVGGFAGYNNNNFTADFSKLPGVPNCCPLYETGTGGGFAIGGLAEVPLLKFLRLETRIGYTTLGGRLFKQEQIGNTSEIGGTNNKTEPVITNHELFTTLNGLSIEPSVTTILFSRVRASIGYRLTYLTTTTFEQSETISSPGYVYFVSDSSRVRNHVTGDLPEVNTIQNSISVGVGLDLPVSSKATFTPEIKYYMAMDKISSVSWSVSTLQFGASFRYALYPPPPPRIIIDTIIQRDTALKLIVGAQQEQLRLLDSKITNDEKREMDGETEVITRTTTITEKYQKEVPKLADLNVAVKAYSVDANGQQKPLANFIVEETEFEENYPLLPQVFFPEGVGELNTSTMKTLSHDEIPTFSEFALPHNTLDVYHELLNIVGLRMTNRPDAKLTIVGCNNNTGVEKNNRELSARRAESVKKYLTETWNISPSRIITKSQNLPSSPANLTSAEGLEENRRVEMYSDDIEILKPVSIKDVTVEANPPIVDVVPTISSEAGIANWSAEIEQEGVSLRKFKGTDNPEKYTWKVTDKPYPKLEQPVDITYTVTDKTGQKKDATASLAVQQLTIKKKRYEQKDDKRIDRFSLIVFDFNKADLNGDNKRIVQEVKQRITPESKITIAGYADRSGDSEYNRELARRRCVETQRSIGLNDSNSTINPIGSDVLLYDNNTPEGRSYSRTVQVIIETPVK
ncbi:MAG: OmpA family protein [Bacteriodetes bacterium]|nr:OmpA family protein [Bacteroidota bacterium]